MVNLEAMQFALPVIATNVGGVEEEIKDGENGLIAEVGDSVSLADKIAWMTENVEERKDMGKNGYKKYCKYFTVSAFERRIVTTLLQELV